MDWKDLAGSVAELGLPILGAAFGVPGPVTTFAAKMVKKALGLPASASADEVQSTINDMDPEAARTALEGAQSEVQAKYAYLTAAVEAAGRVNEKNILEVNKSMRAEVAAGVSWWHWRHMIGYLVIGYGLEQIVLIAYVFFGKGYGSDQLVQMFNSTTPFTLGLFGLLGYVAQDTSNQKIAAITGEKPEGIIVGTVKAITGRKK